MPESYIECEMVSDEKLEVMKELGCINSEFGNLSCSTPNCEKEPIRFKTEFSEEPATVLSSDPHTEFFNRFNGKKVNVLGTEYTIYVVDPDSEVLKNAGTENGFIECWAKQIYISDYARIKDTDKKLCRDVEEFCLKVLRHELVHALFFETGHLDYYEDENLVDTLAYLMPKAVDIMSNQIPIKFFDDNRGDTYVKEKE